MDTVWKPLLSERDRNRKWLEERFFALDYAGLYLGDEMNTFHYDWDRAIAEGRAGNALRVVLANLQASSFTLAAAAVTLFYELLHAYDPSWVVERSLCPPTECNRALMQADGIRPFAVESKMPLAAFDVFCLSMDLAASAVAVPWLVRESGIPLYAAGRGEGDPYVILGGFSVLNPAPFAPFCDILFFGEGEEVLPRLLALLKAGKDAGRPRGEVLLEAARRWDCLYVPRFYAERYDSAGRYAGTTPLRGDVPERVRFARIPDLDRCFLPGRPFLNYCTNPSYAAHYEISRGCEGKCAFCIAGCTCLPFRARSAAAVERMTESIFYETGNLTMTPVSLNSVSHPELNRIIRNLSDNIGDKVILASLRIDGFSANPELCCFISMQGNGRIAFGVEGASQRLRDLVSKNLSEEQILDAMGHVCRYGYQTVKFMMVCGLPTETEADLDELYALCVKIRDVFVRETPPERKPPRLLVSWTPLHCAPHTPLQWAEIPRSLSPAFARFTARMKELGFSTFTPEYTGDHALAQLFLRADGRLSGLLAYLAEEGDLRHEGSYQDTVLQKAVRYLAENGLPPLEDWFRALPLDAPLPWDIVEAPASKSYLARRYRALMEARPRPVPVCTEECSGCGACGEDYRRTLRQMPALREADRAISLRHPVRKTDFTPVQSVLVEYEYDLFHSVVMPAYWDCELRRAMLHAGIRFDPDSVSSFGSESYARHSAAGMNATAVSLGETYDPEELKRRIEAHTDHLRIRSVTETARPLRAVAVTYRMRLPEGMDARTLPAAVKARLAEPEWRVAPWLPFLPFLPELRPEDVRPAVRRLEFEGDALRFTLVPPFPDPVLVYRYLFDLPGGQPLGQFPERLGISFENQGVLDRALTRKCRDDFLRSRQQKAAFGSKADAAMETYISSPACVRDLRDLILRQYRMPPPLHRQIPKNFSGRKRDIYFWKGPAGYLLKLVTFAARDSDRKFSDGLFSFRTSKTAQDFLRKLRNFKDRDRCYVVKADVSNYVASIVPELILPRLEALWGDDPAFLDLMKHLLFRRECIEPDGSAVECAPGALGGVPLANLFMNVYLMELDEYFYPRAPLYCRYSDDIIIFARGRAEAEGYLQHLRAVLAQKRLDTNPEKTRLLEPGQEVEVLGCKAWNGIMDIAEHAKKKLQRKIRMQARKLLKLKRVRGMSDEECGRQLIRYCNTLFFGKTGGRDLSWARWLFPVLTETASLKELDHYVQDAVRYCMCGSLSRKRCRVPYQKLKAMGYRSLVHAYYHFELRSVPRDGEESP